MNDPAVLFYTSDFLTGVIDMTMEERGQYITLLCYQHQKGHFEEKTIRLLVGSCSVTVMKHFIKDEEGLFYNRRMDLEKEKRCNFVESRRNNGALGGRPSNKNNSSNKKPLGFAKNNLMGNENENVIDNDNLIDYYTNNINSSISGIEYEKLKSWAEIFNEDIIKYAIDVSIMNKARNMGYINAVLNNWNKSGYKTLDEVKDNYDKKDKKQTEKERIYEELRNEHR